ncbi:MAG TPA: BrnT family toxin [Acetobacteraceae bacterium]|jgi:hypothetical protein
MEITWREDKRGRNLRNHGLDFVSAAMVFEDPFAVTVFDRVVQQEERWRTIGTLFAGGALRVVVVIHTFPDGDGVEWVHIISMRPADAAERRRYEQVSHR